MVGRKYERISVFCKTSIFKHRHEIKASSFDEALEILRNRYPIKDERYRRLLIITSAFEDGQKIINEERVFNNTLATQLSDV